MVDWQGSESLIGLTEQWITTPGCRPPDPTLLGAKHYNGLLDIAMHNSTKEAEL